MSHQSYLLFELGQSCYGIAAAAVQEVFFLPEVTPVPEAASFVVGVINLRGSILSVVDLQRWLGQSSPPYQLTNSIIVLQWQTQRVGLLVSQVHEVQAIADECIQSGLVYEQWQTASFQRFIAGVVNIDTTLITLLDPERLVQSSSQNKKVESHNGHKVTLDDAIADPALSNLFAHLSTQEQQLLQARAESLRQAIATENTPGIAVTVIKLEGEYFGLSLETVHEFTDIRNVTPIPCCPLHIVGNMNLRGEIVTLVDISQVINLSTHSLTSRQKAIVVRINEIVAGIVVDEIIDVIYLSPAQILAAPVAIHSTSGEYLQGVASYQDKMISIINLSKILTSAALVVDEDW